MKPVTDEDFEAAARRYCELLELDPDERVRLTCVVGCVTGPRWRGCVEDIRRLRAMNQAIKELL